MSTELKILTAFETWRGTARTRYDEAALPTAEELIAAAQDHSELDVGGHYPALLVWAEALKQVRALALTDNTDVIGSHDSLYVPTLAIEPVEYAETEEEYEEILDLEPEPEPEPEPECIDPDLRDYQPHEFRLLDGFSDVYEFPGAGLLARVQDDGSVALEWNLPSYAVGNGLVRLYRVVSDEVEFDRDPDAGEPRAVTVSERWVDRDPLTTAYRHYQVWFHEGTSETHALRSEPRLLAEAAYIRPIDHIDLSVAGSKVKGQWAPLQHTHRVAVFAVKATARRVTRRDEIAVDTQNLQGFRFTPQYKGEEYKFVAERYVLIAGEQRASARSAEFTVYVNAEVLDVPITVDEVFDGFDTRFNISWENPDSGEVRIYRTQEAPTDGLQDRVVEVDQLDSFGLAQRDWANDLERGMSSCTVDWPEDWYSVFLTPVSVVGNQAKVGRSHSRVRVGRITNPTLYERVNNQFLTFGWPEEAHEVTVVFGEPGTGHQIGPRRDELGSNIASIHRQTYEQEGGMRLRLPAAGDIALVPSRVYEGQQIWGDPDVFHYDGLQQFHYEFVPYNGHMGLVVYSDREDQTPRQFTLRMQHGRLPLEPNDGIEVKARRIVGEHPEGPDFLPGINSRRLHPNAVEEFWEVDPSILDDTPQGVFLRLFSRGDHKPGTPVTAVIDPVSGTLSLDQWRAYLKGQSQ
ncbi:hypothetical protein [Corynebacterium comes]|uniref:Uncharacterized protein n=1 Tax=Corynebacterium comes TaxID=2675218 RepID=A0A6B8WFY5_9CORY|nr:hypothetical protein [Corynebacterium comes]QGU05578.1 hypothetical protein CETAM_11730 [Corynebacterium comes]